MILCVREGSRETEIKRSRFIALSKQIETRDEAKNFVERLRAAHPAARHVCYGYIADEQGDDFGYDDDGEPNGTAGKPIYSALAAAKVRKSCVAVVRYFGGIKLGAGGLTRAYRQSAVELIDGVGLAKAERYSFYTATSSGEAFKKASALVRTLFGKVENVVYAAEVDFTVAIRTSYTSELEAALAALGVNYGVDSEKYVFVE